ncbi:hypothetical protein PHISP_01645 [Aspergillus sp. HF37]|nr:hypothetical protein PHISP_01645 [Aspergillus sp. HF37]
MGAVASCIVGVFNSIGACLLGIVHIVGSICSGIVNGIVGLFEVLVTCLTCGYCGRRKGGTGTGSRRIRRSRV